MKKRIILITTKHHSGKSLFATEIKRLLKEKAEVYTGRKIIEDSLKKQSLEVTRESVPKEGARLANLHTESGFGLVIDMMIEKIVQSTASVQLIDSIYYPKAIRAWSNFAGRKGYEILLVAIDASDEIRLSIARAKNQNPEFTLENLAYEDSLENTSDPNKQQLDVCLAQADIVIKNNSTLDAFILGIENFVNKKILLDQ